ncbi:T9SS type A sorting domain-containing protein [Pontibacter sp. 172403-2]|uniref:Ig-like domain-containing protein n=1 Tax=Pontibacter rufus TaxID=2791028 RepID=UPI0018AFEF7C|nr:T9SS type A sorting domain-containing protein [Pontibacter sp. 172403-2]MBF9253901.1 T9SS type A sorting domain-containing protein [Pontibacter sp. 172403-2]
MLLLPIMNKRITHLLSPIPGKCLSWFVTGMLLVVLMCIFTEVSAQSGGDCEATADPGEIDGPTQVCYGAGGVVYSVAAGDASYTYEWTLPEGASIITGDKTNEITVDFNDAASGNRNITVTAVNGCGDKSAAMSSLGLEIYPLPKEPATTAVTRYGPGSVQWAASGAPEGGSYPWYVSNTTAEPIAGATAAVYDTPKLTQPTTTYYVATVSTAGCESSIRSDVAAYIKALPEATIEKVNPGENQCGNPNVNESVEFALTGSTKNAANGILKWEAFYEEGSGITRVDIDYPTTTTPKVHVFGTGSVTVRFTATNDGYTSTPAEIILKVNPVAKSIGSIKSDPENPIAGKAGKFTVDSNIIENGNVGSYQWYTNEGGSGEDKWKLVPIDNQTGRFKTLEITSVPTTLLQVRCDITPIYTNNCYTNLSATTGAYTIESELIVLPVEIIYLQASKQGSNVVLEWATAQEENNKGFFVEMSTDGLSYTSLGFVESKNGNAAVEQLYTFTDRERGKQGTRYYRLRQVDVDGTTAYFGPKTVNFGAAANRVQVYPNPFSSEINLDIEAARAGTVIVTVTNALGRQLLQRKISVQPGANPGKLMLDAHLPQGMYFIHTQMGDLHNSFKMLKQ